MAGGAGLFDGFAADRVAAATFATVSLTAFAAALAAFAGTAATFFAVDAAFAGTLVVLCAVLVVFFAAGGAERFCERALVADRLGVVLFAAFGALEADFFAGDFFVAAFFAAVF